MRVLGIHTILYVMFLYLGIIAGLTTGSIGAFFIWELLLIITFSFSTACQDVKTYGHNGPSMSDNTVRKYYTEVTEMHYRIQESSMFSLIIYKTFHILLISVTGSIVDELHDIQIE